MRLVISIDRGSYLILDRSLINNEMFIYSNKTNSNEIKIKRNKIIDQLSGHRKYVINLEN